MNSYRWLALMCVLLIGLSACSQQAPPPFEREGELEFVTDAAETAASELLVDAVEPEPEPEDTGPTALVAYFSQYAIIADSARAADGISSASIAPGDVERIAGMIREATGADLFEIVAAEPYPDTYDGTAERASLERWTRPALTAQVEDMDRYDVIYVGYPVWAGTYPMPVATFLESYDFSGKTIIPFCTYENYIADDPWADFVSAVPDAELLEGYAISLLNNNRPTEERIAALLYDLELLVAEEQK